MNELAIGEIGVIDGVKVQCLPLDFCYCCQDCYFNREICTSPYYCIGRKRTDHTDVYFKKVEEYD